MRGLLALGTICLVITAGAGGGLVPGTARAEGRSTPVHMGLGVSAFLLTIPYGTVKTCYAVLGAFGGGLAWALTGGRSEVASAIIGPSVRGDYVILPENLTMEEPLAFSGRAPRPPPYP